MTSMYFTNNWHSRLIRDVNKVHNAIRDAISDKQNEIVVEGCSYLKEITQLYQSASGDMFTFSHCDTEIGSLTIRINLDFNAMDISEYVAIRNSVGGKAKLSRSSLWVKFLNLLASI